MESARFELGKMKILKGESLDDDSEPFCACPSKRKSWRLSFCHSGNPQGNPDMMLKENHSGPDKRPVYF